MWREKHIPREVATQPRFDGRQQGMDNPIVAGSWSGRESAVSDERGRCMRASGAMEAERQEKAVPRPGACFVCAYWRWSPRSAHGPTNCPDLSTRIMADPGNVSTSLEYGKLAEASGKPRWALAADGRVLMTRSHQYGSLGGFDPSALAHGAGDHRLDARCWRVRRHQYLSDRHVRRLRLFAQSLSEHLLLVPREDRHLLHGGRVRYATTGPAGDLRWRTTARVEQQMWVGNSQLDGGYVPFSPPLSLGIGADVPAHAADRHAPGPDGDVLVAEQRARQYRDGQPWYDPVWYPERARSNTARAETMGFASGRSAGWSASRAISNGAMQRVDIGISYRTCAGGETYSASRGHGGRRGRAFHPPVRVRRRTTRSPCSRGSDGPDLGDPTDGGGCCAYWDGAQGDRSPRRV